jgi:predicted 3-demethylubiquinone-9 3-methyltransferase (glyoxalase superfamily)
MKHKGYEIHFTRRRYGRTTFTWVYVKFGASWQSTGDPLQKIMPSKKDLDEAIERAHAHRAVGS